MKNVAIMSVLLIGFTGAAFAQTSAPSSNPAAHSQPATSANQPVGSAMTPNANVSPCKKSGTSDRQGGAGLPSTASGGSNSNAGGAVHSKC
jgi:hypothetical protein